jgi:chemotaxis protein histidine kinase CheA
MLRSTPANNFAKRLERVRARFVSTLDSKINDAYAAITHLSEVAPAATDTVDETYRSIHSVVGVGPTVGFPSTGRAARGVEDVLREALRVRRGLNADEILLLKKRLHALREAATREMEMFYTTY